MIQAGKSGPMLRTAGGHARRLIVRVAPAPADSAGREALAMLHASWVVLVLNMACALCDIPSDIEPA